MEFEAFPKIPRLNRNMTITEKIDGTNACVIITECHPGEYDAYAHPTSDLRWLLGAQSRKRLINPTDDNMGFARWVWEHADSLAEDLGPGRHFGEWWGLGIQRGYGLDHKRFSLFNTKRWAAADGHFTTPNLHVVPVLDEYAFSTERIDDCVKALGDGGSCAAPGFPDPEGVVVYHHASGTMAKVTCKNDEKPKGAPDGA